MGAFASPPLTNATLAARLARARFWDQAQLHPLVAKDAICAAKQLARPRVKPAVPQSMQGLVDSSTDTTVLNRLYAHAPVARLVTELSTELLVNEPRPPLATALYLLKHAGLRPPISLCYAVLRTELFRENFAAAFAVLDLVSPVSWSRALGPFAACVGMAVLSATLWAPAPFIGLGLAAFWLGIGWPHAAILPKVVWQQRAEHGWAYRLRHTPQLQMANQIVQYYEDIRGVTVDNFHVHAARPQDPAVERAVHEALSQRGMAMRPARSTELYADYWSEQGYDFGKLEWREPDQDPADWERVALAPPQRRSTYP